MIDQVNENPQYAQPNTCLIFKDELWYRASLIDGTAISLAEYLEDKPIKFILFMLDTFCMVLQISVQTKTEAELYSKLDTLWETWKEKDKTQQN